MPLLVPWLFPVTVSSSLQPSFRADQGQLGKEMLQPLCVWLVLQAWRKKGTRPPCSKQRAHTVRADLAPWQWLKQSRYHPDSGELVPGPAWPPLLPSRRAPASPPPVTCHSCPALRLAAGASPVPTFSQGPGPAFTSSLAAARLCWPQTPPCWPRALEQLSPTNLHPCGGRSCACFSVRLCLAPREGEAASDQETACLTSTATHGRGRVGGSCLAAAGSWRMLGCIYDPL